jgi:GxxExxY protein
MSSQVKPPMSSQVKPPMNADERQLDLDAVTAKIIGCAYRVSNTLGAGFLEKVYENALAHELRTSGLGVEQQKSIQVCYDGVVVGDYFADLVVDRCVLVELKAVRALDDIHVAQRLNYLKASGLTVCLLMNFAEPRVKIKRIVNRY